MPVGALSNEDVEFVEEWENVTEITNYIIRIGPRGDEVYEQVSENERKFKITSYERKITEDRILDPKHNPFRNGCFRPVLVADDVTIDTNPNALSQDQILDIFSSSDFAWNEWMTTIDAPATYRRMVAIAEATEAISLKRFNELRSRLEALSGPKGKRQKALDDYEKAKGEEIDLANRGGSKRR